MPLLQLNNIEVRYMGVSLVLRGVSLHVEEGGLVALLGANGAGKTTTVKAISGLLKTEEGKVSQGTIEYRGKKIQNGNPEDVARSGVIQVQEGRKIVEHLTVDENLRAGGCVLHNRSRLKERLHMVYEYFPRLDGLRGLVSGYLSGGEQQMLVLGRALMASPTLMLIDEASLGLAPMLQKEIFEIIKRINSEDNISILLVEQNAKAALSVCEYAYIMENGRIVLEGSAAHLVDNEDIREFYLGLSFAGEHRSYRNVKHYRRRKRWLS